jgi:hypothetical protein
MTCGATSEFSAQPFEKAKIREKNQVGLSRCLVLAKSIASPTHPFEPPSAKITAFEQILEAVDRGLMTSITADIDC